jgi:hypothetical protein
MNPNLKSVRLIPLCPSALLSSLATFSLAQNVPFCFICLLYLKIRSGAQKVRRPTTTTLMNSQSERIRKQMVTSEAVTVSWHLGGWNEENHQRPQSRL